MVGSCHQYQYCGVLNSHVPVVHQEFQVASFLVLILHNQGVGDNLASLGTNQEVCHKEDSLVYKCHAFCVAGVQSKGEEGQLACVVHLDERC